MSDAAAPVPTDDSRARRLRLLTILGIAALAGLTLLATTQTWWTVVLSTQSIAVAGTVASPALSALSLSGLALAAALAIAGPFFRFVLGILQLLIGFTVVLTSALSVASPQKNSEALISKTTGVAGTESIHALIKSIGFTPWGTVAIVLGVLTFLAGAYLLVTFRRWPVASRKYQAVRFENASGERDAVIDWDSLSDGEDPTARGGNAER
ncbi:MAG: hypothetical protein JWR36_99 [Glaciihabitans sp.]|nr:hypothetical protein [Glaciihabitans sp.]